MRQAAREQSAKLPCFRRDDDQGDGKSSNEQEARIFNQVAISLSAIIFSLFWYKAHALLARI
jgi:hypothetical protein